MARHGSSAQGWTASCRPDILGERVVARKTGQRVGKGGGETSCKTS